MDGDRLMPYDTLPQRYRDLIPGESGQDIFRNTLNAQMAAGKDEEGAFASAWAALERAGYAKDDKGKWVKKTQPTLSQVHVPGAMDDDEDDLAKQSYQPPEAARNNAKRVLRWREEHGDEVNGMTSVGWARARQLASGKPVSRSTVARMSAFNRHRSNATIAPEHKGEPWKDAGYVAWLGWGGTAGIDFARRIMGSLTKRLMTDDSFTTREEAVARSYDLGLEGEIHVHQTADGQAVYMPGEDHEEYLEHMAERAGIMEPEDYSAEGKSDSQETLLQQAISAILNAVIDKEDPVEKAVTKTSDILKVDSERRIVWGWASVSTMKGELVTDLQGDRIAPPVMEKMADRFMRSARAAKAMHDGDDVGEVIHSFPLTKELAEAFGIKSDREGWITGTYIKSDAIWTQVQQGTFKGLSIGGKAKRKEVME